MSNPLARKKRQRDVGHVSSVVLISALGGISVFGLNGFVIGPVIAAMFIAVSNPPAR